MKKSCVKIGLAATILFALDYGTKWLAALWLTDPFQVTSWFSFEYGRNYGTAWSLPVPAEIILPLNLVIFVLAAVWFYKTLDLNNNYSVTALSLFFGGALGNLHDRLFFGYVVDFIKIGWWPVFNLADIYLTAGIFIIIVFYGKIKRHN